jgi:DNA-binding NarL/FixJ family response regulator
MKRQARPDALEIFVVDDSRLLRERLAALIGQSSPLQLAGEAEDAATAIAAIGEKKPDVVILDIRLRSGNGFDVLHAIRHGQSSEQEHDRRAPVVIVLTSYDYPEYRAQSRASGADYFLTKAHDLGRLAGLLKDLSARRPFPASNTRNLQTENADHLA